MKLCEKILTHVLQSFANLLKGIKRRTKYIEGQLKPVVAMFVALTMLLSIMPVTIFAAENTDALYVGGVEVTDSNATDVFGDGKVSYDSTTNTLTLNNYNYEGAGDAPAIFTKNDLNIKLVGKNTIIETNNYAIEVWGKLAITDDTSDKADSVLNLTALKNCIYSDADLIIENVTVNVNGVRGIEAYDNITIKNAIVAAEVSDGNAITANAQVTIENADVTAKSTSRYGIDASWRTYEAAVVIKNSTVSINAKMHGISTREISIASSTVEVTVPEGWNAISNSATATGLVPRFTDSMSREYKVYAGVTAPGELVASPTVDTYASRYIKIVPGKILVPIWIGDEQFTIENLTINGTKGTATYDPDSNTLTLNNFKYEGEGYEYSSGRYAGIYALGIDLNIKLVGTNVITMKSDKADYIADAINCWYVRGVGGNMKIYGTDKQTDSLTFTANGESKGICCVRTLTIDNATIAADSDVNTGYVCANSDGIVTNSTISSNMEIRGDLNVEKSEIEIKFILEVSDNLTIAKSIVRGGSISAFDHGSITTITGKSTLDVIGISTFALLTEESDITAQVTICCFGIFKDSTVRVTGADLFSDGKTYAFIICSSSDGGSIAIEHSTVEAYGSEGAYLFTEDFETFTPCAPLYVDGEQQVTADGYIIYVGETTPGKVVDSPTDDTYVNKYVKIAPAFTVTYKVDSEVIKTEKVECGKDATLPTIPTKEGYDQTPPTWDKDGKNITSDTEINAVYTKNLPGEYKDVTQDTNFGGGKLTENITELKKKIPFTQAEEKQIEYGADVGIWLEIKDISDYVPAEDKEKISEKLGDYEMAMYLDIAMFKKVGENQASRLTQLNDKVSITFKLPDSYINKDKNVTRNYRIIHVHNGKVETISPVFDAQANTLTFLTDRFSTYAVVYSDVEADATTDIPKTGDELNLGLWGMAMIVSAITFTVCMNEDKKKKQKNN